MNAPGARALACALLALATGASALASDTERGGELYRRHCANCHGASGKPVLPSAPDFTRPGALMKSDLTLLGSLKTGRGAMPAYAGLLRERELLDIVAHLRTLR